MISEHYMSVVKSLKELVTCNRDPELVQVVCSLLRRSGLGIEKTALSDVTSA